MGAGSSSNVTDNKSVETLRVRVSRETGKVEVMVDCVTDQAEDVDKAFKHLKEVSLSQTVICKLEGQCNGTQALEFVRNNLLTQVPDGPIKYSHPTRCAIH